MQTRLDIILETVSRILEAEQKGRKPDYLDFDKDGNKKEPMVDAIKDAKEKKKFRVPPAASTRPDTRTRSQIEIEHGAIP